jgi:hypothetical protein
MSNTLKRYAPSCHDMTLSDGDELTLFMDETPGGLYINEDELRRLLGGLMNAARSQDELAAYQKVMEVIDTPNW